MDAGLGPLIPPHLVPSPPLSEERMGDVWEEN